MLPLILIFLICGSVTATAADDEYPKRKYLNIAAVDTRLISIIGTYDRRCGDNYRQAAEMFRFAHLVPFNRIIMGELVQSVLFTQEGNCIMPTTTGSVLSTVFLLILTQS